MRGKKRLLADILFRKLRCASLPCFSFGGNHLLYVLAYHRLAPQHCRNYPFSKGTISATLDDFDKQMRFVSKRFNVIGFEELSKCISSGRSLPENSLIITFDDGYADNYEIAWEVLKRYELTATIFLAVSSVETSTLFWFDKLSYMMNKFSGKSIKIGEHVFKPKNDNREMVRESVMALFSSVSEQERLGLFAEMERQCNIRVQPEDSTLPKPLSWKQIDEMSKGGMEFGSHTMSHPFLENLSEEEIMYELRESKLVIERSINKEVKAVAYPSGSYDRRVLYCAKKCGYQFGVSYENNVREFDRDRTFEIPRIHVETDVDYSQFQANLLLPGLFLKNSSLHMGQRFFAIAI